MNQPKEPTDRRIIATARRLYEDEGTIEIDAAPAVSRGSDPGAYVAAWVWVPFDEIPEEDPE